LLGATMRYKASFITGVAAGYVLGARAGRERYEKIKRAAQSAWSNPQVQHAADSLQARTGNFVGSAAHVAAEKGKVISQRVGDKLPNRLTEKLPAGLRGHHAEDEAAWHDYATSSATAGSTAS